MQYNKKFIVVEKLAEIISNVAENTEEAMDIAKELANLSPDIWNEWMEDKNQRLHWECQNCGKPEPGHVFENFCRECYSAKRRNEFLKVQQHLNRARNESLPATLTYRQWMDARGYFNHQCAYCNSPVTEKTIVLEHYIPINRGGGTTVHNVLPSCSTCNGMKSDNAPSQFVKLFPASNMQRIADYFESTILA